MKILSLFLPAALVLTVLACSDDDTESVPTVPTNDAGSTADGSTTPPTQDDASAPENDGGPGDGATTTFAITAPWAEGAAIPTQYSCDGANGSPALSWTGAPAGTQGLAIVMRDESLARAGNYHWVLYEIPATTTSLPATLPRSATVNPPAGARQTKWSFSEDRGYGGPCPPPADAAHSYRITLHALNATLGELANNPETADTAIKAASIASVSVLGTFDR